MWVAHAFDKIQTRMYGNIGWEPVALGMWLTAEHVNVFKLVLWYVNAERNQQIWYQDSMQYTYFAWRENISVEKEMKTTPTTTEK